MQQFIYITIHVSNTYVKKLYIYLHIVVVVGTIVAVVSPVIGSVVASSRGQQHT